MKNFLTLIFIAGILIFGFVAYYNLNNRLTRPAIPIVLTTGEYAPYVGADLDGDGPVSRIVSETLLRMGYRPDIRFSSWSVALSQVKRGQAYGSFPFIKNEERQEQSLFSDPLLTYEYGFFYRKSNFPQPDLYEALTQLEADSAVYGIVGEGYSTWPELDASSLRRRDYSTIEDAFQALAGGEVDLVVEGQVPGFILLQSPGLNLDPSDFGFFDVNGREGFGKHTGLHFLIDRQAGKQAFIDKFNKMLAEVKKTALYEEALADMHARPSRKEEVELVPAGADALIRLLSPGGGPDMLAPRGTRAVVLEWPAPFSSGAARIETDSLRCRIKVLNGPLQGRLFWVDARSIYLLSQ